MKLRFLQHVPFENPGRILTWAETRKQVIAGSHLYRGDPLPVVSDFDFLIIMGGPMGAGDEQLYPWLVPEKRLISEAVLAEKNVLGICLGAQLIASALDARVYANSEKEIGFYPVSLIPAGDKSPFRDVFPEQFTAFHWHGDTFDLPNGSHWLLRSEACMHQAFTVGENVLGMQFHIECECANIESLIRHCGHEIVPGRYIQSGEEMLRAESRHTSLQQMTFTLLDRFLATG